MDDIRHHHPTDPIDADIERASATAKEGPSAPARAGAPKAGVRPRRRGDPSAAEPAQGRQAGARAPADATGGALDLYLGGMARRPLLTREGEVELARRIEEGERALLAGLVGVPAALRELAALAGELRAGALRPRDVLRDAPEEGPADDPAAGRLIGALERAGALADVIERGGAHAREGRAVLAELSRARLHRRALDRAAAAARAAPAAGAAGRRARAAMEAGLRDADRAKAELVESNLRLVVLFARRHRNQGLQLLDLIQEGNIGLMRASDKFDHRRGIRFSTYAAWWVRQQMARALAEQGKTIRVPVHMLESRQKLTRARRRFVHEHGREPDELELVEQTGILPEKVRAVSGIAPEPISLQAPSGAEGEATVGDFVADRATPAPDEQIARTRMAAQARALVDTLTPREQEVLRLRFGLGGGEELTLQEIGARLSVSRERVRQIEAQALRKLRGPSKRGDLDSYFDAA